MSDINSDIDEIMRVEVQFEIESKQCLDDCSDNVVQNNIKSDVTSLISDLAFEEKVNTLTHIVEMMINLQKDVSVYSSEQIYMKSAYERIGVVVWNSIYIEIEQSITNKHGLPKEGENTHKNQLVVKKDVEKYLQEYAKKNFKHNYRLYLLIAKAAVKFHFLENREGICTFDTSKLWDTDKDHLVINSIMTVRDYVREEITEEIANAISDTRVVNYWLSANKKKKPEINKITEKLLEYYDNMLNKNQTIEVLKTVNILFYKESFKIEKSNKRQLKELHKMYEISEDIKGKKYASEIKKYTTTFLSYLNSYRDEYNKGDELTEYILLLKGITSSISSEFYKNSIFLIQMYKYLYANGEYGKFYSSATLSLEKNDCILDIKESYLNELYEKNEGNDIRITINILIDQRNKITDDKYLVESFAYMINRVMEWILTNFIEQQVMDTIDKTYRINLRDIVELTKINGKELLEDHKKNYSLQYWNEEFNKYYKRVINYKNSENPKYCDLESDYLKLKSEKVKLLKRYFEDKAFDEIDTEKLIELLIWLDHIWWGLRNYEYNKLISEDTDEVVMRWLLQGKNKIICYEEKKRKVAANESLYLFIAILQNLMQRLYYTTKTKSDILNEDFKRGNTRTPEKLLEDKLKKDKEAFERLCNYILPECRDEFKIDNDTLAKAKDEILSSDIHIIDMMLGTLVDKAYVVNNT